MCSNRVSVIIPTFNGGKLWHIVAEKLANTSGEFGVFVCDSTSLDDSVEVAKKYNFDVSLIPSSEFNHGGTRDLMAEKCKNSDYLVFLTQDAILDDSSSIENIIKPFLEDEQIAAVCGRQLPHDDANPIARHARFFNYPASSKIRSLSDIPQDGIKVAFMSNSFSAYRTEVFFKLGGFPSNTILAEDMFLAAKMILAGYKVAYIAEAKVKHSHNYTPWQELKRYFDIGVFHAQEPWIRESFGNIKGEGRRFLVSEFKYLMKNAPLYLPLSFIQNAFKLIGYKLGLKYEFLSIGMRKKFSMHNRYWK